MVADPQLSVGFREVSILGGRLPELSMAISVCSREVGSRSRDRARVQHDVSAQTVFVSSRAHEIVRHLRKSHLFS